MSLPMLLISPGDPLAVSRFPTCGAAVTDGGGKTEEWKGKMTVSEEKCACAHGQEVSWISQQVKRKQQAGSLRSHEKKREMGEVGTAGLLCSFFLGGGLPLNEAPQPHNRRCRPSKTCFLVRRLQSEEAFNECREINYTHGELRIPF